MSASGIRVAYKVHGTANLLTELVSIHGVHFGPERIGRVFLFGIFPFKRCPRSLLQEVIMGEEMHSIFQRTTMTITPRVRPPELPQSARLPEIPGRRQQRSLLLAQFPALVRNVPAKGPLIMLGVTPEGHSWQSLAGRVTFSS